MAKPAEHQQPTAPPPKEEGPRSFAVFLRKLAAGEAESALSYEMHELGKKLKDEAEARSEKVKGSLTLTINFEAEPEDGLVMATYDVKTKAPKPKRAKGYFWLTKGGNLASEQPKTKQGELPFGAPRDLAPNAQGIPRDLDDGDEQPPREV